MTQEVALREARAYIEGALMGDPALDGLLPAIDRAAKILATASWYCRMYSNVIGDDRDQERLHAGCNPQFHVWAVFMAPETAAEYRR